ncbi:Metal-dependent hydrolases of the beta-lactamase superfamily I [Salinisphaera sp. PC39]|uniref:hypothetical protein n=1 Tax=Salinisphaera sp. PC39 TaxID=1304156 RepID=UPI00333FF066
MTPSLGRLENATVNFYRSDGATLITTLETAQLSDGVSLDGYRGPLVVEVLGDGDARYFDESTLTMTPFPEGASLYAVYPRAEGDFAMSILTDLAHRIAMQRNLFPLSVREAEIVNAIVRHSLAPELGSQLTPPTVFDAGTTSGSLDDDGPGRYALKIAALASLAESEPSPSLAILDYMRSDISDGRLDGDGSAPYTDLNLAVEVDGGVRELADDFGTVALQAATTTYRWIDGHINMGFLALGEAANGLTYNIGAGALVHTEDVETTAADAAGFMTFSASLSEAGLYSGTVTLRFPAEVGRYECSEDDSGTYIRTQYDAGLETVTTGEGDCYLEVLKAGDVIEGLVSGRVVSAGDGSVTGEFEDGYFYYDPA